MSMRCCRHSVETEPAFDNLRSQTTSGSYLALRTDNSVVSYDNIEVARFKKYYAAGGVRVAMQEAETVSFLLTDHLGSTAVAADLYGAETGKLLYKPWGETRYSSGSTPTTTPGSTQGYTGQREDASIGLYFYGARYYDPALGRFVQADTIVPKPGKPQSLNRYSYVLNNASSTRIRRAIASVRMWSAPAVCTRKPGARFARTRRHPLDSGWQHHRLRLR